MRVGYPRCRAIRPVVRDCIRAIGACLERRVSAYGVVEVKACVVLLVLGPLRRVGAVRISRHGLRGHASVFFRGIPSMGAEGRACLPVPDASHNIPSTGEGGASDACAARRRSSNGTLWIFS